MTPCEDAILIREATAADIPAIAAVHVASWREHYHGIVDDRLIEERTVERRIATWSAALGEPRRLTFVAEDDGGTVIGFGSALVFAPPLDGFDSYLQTLYLVSSAKGRGTGRALLRVLAAALVARGCNTMALRVVRRNPARAFYEHLGARIAPAAITIDAELFDDVVYVFDDVKVLL